MKNEFRRSAFAVAAAADCNLVMVEVAMYGVTLFKPREKIACQYASMIYGWRGGEIESPIRKRPGPIFI